MVIYWWRELWDRLDKVSGDLQICLFRKKKLAEYVVFLLRIHGTVHESLVKVI